MNPEVVIILYLLNKQNYLKYINYVNKYIKDKSFKNILSALDYFYDEYKKEEVSLEEFSLFYKTKYPSDTDNHNILKSLSDVIISEDVLKDVLEKIKDRAVATDLAVIALEVSEGTKDKSYLVDKFSELSATVKIEEETFVTTDLTELYDHQVQKPGLRWRLQTLNQMLGSLRKGDFGFLFARPESGKTTFLCSEITYFAQQAEGSVLWFNNEEQGEKVALRLYQAALGVTQDELFRDIDKYRELYKQVTGDRIKIYDSASIHKRAVESLCESIKPSLIVFDQIDKVKGFTADREDLHLGAIYIWARELAKTYCPVIGVCQASGEGEGRMWLTMDHVSGAKTSKQAEADWILGIGKSNEEGHEYVRGLHLSKNKLTGDPDSIPDKRHGREQVLIEPHIARYKDML